MRENKEGEGRLTQQAVFRIGVILLTIVVVFLFGRQMAIPASFGEYGRYRGDSISENTAKEPNYAASNEDCKKCHAKQYDGMARGEHKDLNCQTCHGPGAKHVKTPSQFAPKVTGNEQLCAACHNQIAGRRKGQISTVKPVWHSGGADCVMCHNPHQPWDQTGGGGS